MDPKHISDVMSENEFCMLEPWKELEKYGDKIISITDQNGDSLIYTIHQTMMRVELPQALKQGEQFTFQVTGTTI